MLGAAIVEDGFGDAHRSQDADRSNQYAHAGHGLILQQRLLGHIHRQESVFLRHLGEAALEVKYKPIAIDQDR